MSLTTVLAKICERVVKDRWAKYLKEDNQLQQKKFEFEKEDRVQAVLSVSVQ